MQRIILSDKLFLNMKEPIKARILNITFCIKINIQQDLIQEIIRMEVSTVSMKLGILVKSIYDHLLC